METPIQFLSAAILLGIAAGLTPGPLLTLIVAETIRSGKKSGIKIALVPLTDPPIIFLSIFALNKFSETATMLAIISFGGVLFLSYLAYETFQAGKINPLQNKNPQTDHAFRKGVITNILSPHPYLFWITIGGPTVIKAARLNLFYAFLYIAGLYSSLIGSKILLALLVNSSKKTFNQKAYTIVMRILACALALFAVLLIKDGIQHLSK